MKSVIDKVMDELKEKFDTDDLAFCSRCYVNESITCEHDEGVIDLTEILNKAKAKLKAGIRKEIQRTHIEFPESNSIVALKNKLSKSLIGEEQK